MTREREGPPQLAAKLLGRVWPGPLGVDACSDLGREFARRKDRHGRLVAVLWYMSHFVRPSTWVLSQSLRRARRFGPSHRSPATSRIGLGISWLDVKLGLRMLVKHPGVTFVSGLAMSVTIALAVGTFSMLEDRLLRPTLPLPEGDRIVSIGLYAADRGQPTRQLLHDFQIWREEVRTVQQLSIWRWAFLNVVAEDGIGRPMSFTMMTASGFEVASVPPLMGRPLLPADEIIGAPPVMVIGYDEWRVHHAADPDVVGRGVQIGRERYTIVGVMPERYGFPFASQRWIPFQDDSDAYAVMETPHIYYVSGRLAPDVTIAQAQAEVATIANRRAMELPRSHEHMRAEVMPYADAFTGMNDPVQILQVWLLLFVFSALVLIPFVNVAILLYARTATRAGELSVRSALGASRARVVTQLFVEALVLSSGAAVVGAGFALYVLSHVDAFLPGFGNLAFWARQGRDPVVAVYVLALVVVAAVVAGMIPGLKATGRGVQARLNRASSGSGMRLGAGWTALIVAQIATTVAFLPLVASMGWQIVGAGLARPTFDAQQLIGAYISAVPIDRMEELAVPDPTGRRAANMERARLSIEEIIRRLEADPRVSGLTLSTLMPGQLFEVTHRVEVEGVPPPDDGPAHRVAAGSSIADNFLDVIGVVPSVGRVFHAGDADAERPPLMVNRKFVERVLEGANPIGRRVRFYNAPDSEPGPWMEVVGVVDDLVLNPTHPEVVEPRIFSPFDRTELARGAYLMVKVPEATQSFVPEFRRLVTAVDPTIQLSPVVRVGEMNDVLSSLMGAGAVAFGVVVVSALLLCTAGVFSMMSLNVTQRRREIGLRSALGAGPERVLAVVMGRSIKQLGLGILVGLAIVLSIPPINVDGVLIGRDAVPVIFVALVIVFAGVVAAIGPAREGLRVHPSEALREG